MEKNYTSLRFTEMVNNVVSNKAAKKASKIKGPESDNEGGRRVALYTSTMFVVKYTLTLSPPRKAKSIMNSIRNDIFEQPSDSTSMFTAIFEKG